MKIAKQQQGMTLIGWLLVLGFLALVVMFMLRVAPGYLENFSVRSTLESLKKEGEEYRTAGEVRAAIMRRLAINNVSNVTSEDIVIGLERGMYNVNISYEVRTPFMYNIDLILSFDQSAEVPAS